MGLVEQLDGVLSQPLEGWLAGMVALPQECDEHWRGRDRQRCRNRTRKQRGLTHYLLLSYHNLKVGN
jgi:hypothetical protein